MPGTPEVLLLCVPGEGPVVPRQLDSALSLGTREPVSPWGSPYKAMGQGELYAWVGWATCPGNELKAQLPSGPLPGDSPSWQSHPVGSSI